MRCWHWKVGIKDEVRPLVSVSALTLTNWWQKGHPTIKNHSTNLQRFSARTDGGEGPNEEPADPGSSGKMAVKWK